MVNHPIVDDPELLTVLGGGDLPQPFADPSAGVVLARCSREQFIALLVVYPREFDEDDPDRYPFDHDIAVFARNPDGTFTDVGAGGSDWRLGFGRLPRGVPPWLSGGQSGCRFGTFFAGAVSDLRDLDQLPSCGADEVPPVTDAPTGAFVVRLRDDDAAQAEWERQLGRPETHLW